MNIVRANLDHLALIAPLFDQYRVFYKQDSNLEKAKNFLEDRISRNESVVFLAMDNDTAVGFVQLFTSFSSVSLQPIFILNDLYVHEVHRGKGIGEALLTRTKEFCLEKGYKGLALETGIENPAQQLYERLGWEKDTDCFHYFWTSK